MSDLYEKINTDKFKKILCDMHPSLHGMENIISWVNIVDFGKNRLVLRDREIILQQQCLLKISFNKPGFEIRIRFANGDLLFDYWFDVEFEDDNYPQP